MLRYDQLRTLSFRIDRNAGESLAHDYQVLPFPEAWKTPLLALAGERPGRPLRPEGRFGNGQVSIPIHALNAALRALVPDLTGIASNAAREDRRPHEARRGPQPWLRSARAVDVGALGLIAHAWVRSAAFEGASPARRAAAWEEIRSAPLRWSPARADIGASGAAANGTARMPSEVYDLVPGLLAAHLSRPAVAFPIAGRAIRFRRAPATEGARLFSWPPEAHHDRRGEWFWSVSLHLRLRTVPFQAHPAVYCDVGVARWASTTVRLPQGKSSVYLLAAVPWIEGVAHSPSFTEAPISWQRGRQADGATLPAGVDWADELPAVLAGLTLASPLPAANRIPEDPRRALDPLGDGAVTAALTYRHGTMGHHGVEDGLMPPDRNAILEWLAAELALWLRVDAPLSRVAYKRVAQSGAVGPAAGAINADPRRGGGEPLEAEGAGDVCREMYTGKADIAMAAPDANPGAVRKAKEKERRERRKREERMCDASALRAELGRAGNGTLPIRVAYQSRAVLDALVMGVEEELGLVRGDRRPTTIARGTADETIVWDVPGLRVSLHPTPLGALGGDLDLDPGVTVRRDRRKRAIEMRADDVAAHTAAEPRADPGGAEAARAMGIVVEIGKTNFGRDEDPKFALRLGYARAGLLSQFLVSPGQGGSEETLEHRAQAAIRDLVLRQRGILPRPPRVAFAREGLPDPLNYVGLWLIKEQGATNHAGAREQIPVLVRIASGHTAVEAFAPGFSDWLPYHEGLLKLAHADPFASTARDAGRVVRWIEQAIEQQVAASGPTVLLTHAQNLRSVWQGLKDSELGRDALVFTSAEGSAGSGAARPIAAYPGLRHVRVRVADQGETPECYGYDPEGAIGLSAGLWAWPGSDRVFGSTGAKPATASTVSKGLSKLASFGAGESGRPANPGGHAYNPQLVEITVAALQPGDTPWVWAALVHELRRIAPHYPEATVLPLPLHLARLMGEYVLPLGE